MKYLKVKDYEHFLRDSATNCIINTNTSEYQEYIVKRDLQLTEKQRIQSLETNFDIMKNDLDEIKNLLKRLVNES